MRHAPSRWHHSPAHVFVPNTTYMVTAGTHGKANLFLGKERLSVLQDAMFHVMAYRKWELEAWALFSNHYHFIAKAPEDHGRVDRLVQHLHTESSRRLNEVDGQPGRKVWFQYWDTCLTYDRSYYARLNYVMQNAVGHGLVRTPAEYPFCSAAWFEGGAASGLLAKVASFMCDTVNVNDDFVPAPL